MSLKKHTIPLPAILLNSSFLFGQHERKPVSTLKVTTLSTMVVNGKGVGSVGDIFDLENGIKAGIIAR
jgi:hypothetical protein